jgi:hypothetical protein
MRYTALSETTSDEEAARDDEIRAEEAEQERWEEEQAARPTVKETATRIQKEGMQRRALAKAKAREEEDKEGMDEAAVKKRALQDAQDKSYAQWKEEQRAKEEEQRAKEGQRVKAAKAKAAPSLPRISPGESRPLFRVAQ